MTLKFPSLFSKRFHRLQWKLTISYMITSVTVLCLLELLVVWIGTASIDNQDRKNIVHRAQLLARIVNSTSPSSEPSQLQQIQAVWELLKENNNTLEGYATIVDTHGQVVVAAGDQAPVSESDLRSTLPTRVKDDIQTMLSSPSPDQKTSFDQDITYLSIPLQENGTFTNVMVFKFSISHPFTEMLLFFGVSAIVFFVGAGVVGIAFGVVTARSLVRRLQYIMTAVNGWSVGDFSVFVRDSARDELGQLARRLNQMARQLQQLLRTRLDLATLEERNRLARDLHDSIKQQVFAVSLHVSTTKALIGRNEEAAQTHLLKAEGLIRQTQRELTTLISELRPVALEGRNLQEALQIYLHAWQEQTGIIVDLEVDGETEVTRAIENAFFRIVQEGLANVVRHSQAQAVKIHLTRTDMVTLSIHDDGHGFDPQSRDHQGVGLSSMRERIQALGGQIDIQSHPDTGTTITVQCPQKQKDPSTLS